MNKILTLITISLAATFTSQATAQVASNFGQPIYTTTQPYIPIQNYSAPVQSNAPVQTYTQPQLSTTRSPNVPTQAHIDQFRRLKRKYRNHPGVNSTRMDSYMPPRYVATPIGTARLIFSTRNGYTPRSLSAAVNGTYVQPQYQTPIYDLGGTAVPTPMPKSSGAAGEPVYNGGRTAVLITGRTLIDDGIILEEDAFLKGFSIVQPKAAGADRATPAPKAEVSPQVPVPATAKDTGDGT